MASRITVGRNEKAAWILTNTQACIPARRSLCLNFTERLKIKMTKEYYGINMMLQLGE